MSIHILNEWKKPAWSNLNIGIQQYGILGINLLKGPVVTLGKAVVLVQHNSAHHGEDIGKQGQGAVGRAIVGNIYHGFAHRRGQYGVLYYRREKLA